MLTEYLKRGVITGLVGGLAYGLFVALAATPLIAHAEAFEAGHHDPAVSEFAAITTSIGAGVGWGVLLGIVVFGFVYFFLEPLLPGRDDTKSYVVGAAGFVTVSGAPWLILPPVPPGAVNALATETRIIWYAVMMLCGAVACGLSVYLYRRLKTRWDRYAAAVGALAPFALLVLPVILAPSNSISGPIPADLVIAFRWVVVAGQVGLWVILASTHAWLMHRTPADNPMGTATTDPDLTPSEA